ncbi:MAG: HDOD domain-containing protein [Acidimicrobiia bacterium]
MIDLDALAQAASGLDPLPMSSVRLAQLAARDDVQITEIVEIVEYDQAITGRLLKTANSSWSASSRAITTVRDAVVRLGTGTVVSVALASNVRAQMHRAVPEYGLAEGDLWRHSVASALAAELMPRHCGVAVPPETVSAALLHDIGKLLMSRFLDPDLLGQLTEAQARTGEWIEAERELLGVHHAELGGLITQTWGLPESMVRGICYHHEPDVWPEPIAHAVFLADAVAKIVGLGIGESPGVESFVHAVEALRMRPEAFDVICELTAERLAEVAARYE